MVRGRTEHRAAAQVALALTRFWIASRSLNLATSLCIAARWLSSIFLLSSKAVIWPLSVAKRASLRKAKVALARKLAVVLHRMMRDQTSFVSHIAAPVAAA